MNNTESIFIFTKDRLATLIRTLTSIQTVSYSKYVIDDSVNSENQEGVSELCKQYSNCNYLGKEQFNKFVSENKIEFPKFNFLLRELGRAEWNLGYARNFALIYSQSIHANKVLFMDDDIQVSNLKLIDDLFQSLKDFQFVGANITGLVDDSVLGHIATDLGIFNERMLSGGFMAFNPNNIDHNFLNNYNEDWIWLFLQLKNDKYLQTGKVFQELSDPLSNYKDKVIFQEFGEIALDGILDLYKEGSYDTLIQLSFWERIIQEREEYLELLASKAGNKKSLEIVSWVKNNSGNFNAEFFQKLFQDYFMNRFLFLKLYNSL
jgi:hypothetical protein